MTLLEYNDMVELLYRGHDLDFCMNEDRFFLENEGNNRGLYKYEQNHESAKLIRRFYGKDMVEQVNAFLQTPLFGNKAFFEIYVNIEIVDIE